MTTPAKAPAEEQVPSTKVELLYVGVVDWTSAMCPEPQTFKPRERAEVDASMKDLYLSLRDRKTKQPLFQEPPPVRAIQKREADSGRT